VDAQLRIAAQASDPQQRDAPAAARDALAKLPLTPEQRERLDGVTPRSTARTPSR
jgi:hypothetical protein